jgi:hypothetical protein
VHVFLFGGGFDEHEAAVIPEALIGGLGGDEEGRAEGFDRVYIKLGCCIQDFLVIPKACPLTWLIFIVVNIERIHKMGVALEGFREQKIRFVA